MGQQISEAVIRHEGVSKAEARKRALEMLERVRIPSAARRLDAYPHEMSGGMRQRAMIALALSCRPKLLLADEPTTALDATVQIQILLLLRELQRDFGMSVIFVTHDIGAAVEVSDRLAVMYAGEIRGNRTVRDILRDPRHPYTRGLLAANLHGAEKGTRLEAIPAHRRPCMSRRPPAVSLRAAAMRRSVARLPCRRSCRWGRLAMFAAFWRRRRAKTPEQRTIPRSEQSHAHCP